jgi:hypothetical protein
VVTNLFIGAIVIGIVNLTVLVHSNKANANGAVACVVLTIML